MTNPVGTKGQQVGLCYQSVSLTASEVEGYVWCWACRLRRQPMLPSCSGVAEAAEDPVPNSTITRIDDIVLMRSEDGECTPRLMYRFLFAELVLL